MQREFEHTLHHTTTEFIRRPFNRLSYAFGGGTIHL